MAIISILATSATSNFNGSMDLIKQRMTKALMKRIVHTLTSYRITQPSTLRAVTSQSCTECTGGVGGGPVPAVDWLTNNLSWRELGYASTPLDAWGRPLTLHENDQNTPGSCVCDTIRGAGPDGLFGTADDQIISVPPLSCAANPLAWSCSFL